MAPAMATKRLREELIKLKIEPPPGIIAEPDESNILKWFYVIRGPSDTPYEGGIYIGKLIFPSEYPMKAPSIHVLTPSGRFAINTQICMSMSNFHPESWNPMWSVATIIQGVQSFMASDEMTTGGLKASNSDRKKLAKFSTGYNQKNYPKLFDGDIEASLEEAAEVCQKAEEENAKSTSDSTGKTSSSTRRSRRTPRKAGTTEQENSEEDADKDSNGGSTVNEQKSTLSRRERRLAKMAAVSEKEKPDQKKEKIDNSNGSGDEINNREHTSTSVTTKDISPAEIEKRRKRNAQKRAKQKAKKSASSVPEDSV